MIVDSLVAGAGEVVSVLVVVQGMLKKCNVKTQALNRNLNIP